MPTTTPCARASSPPSSASCWNAVGSPLRPKRRWLVLALSKAGTTPSGCIPHWAIARPWPTKLPWRQSQPNRNHPSPQTLHEIGATSYSYAPGRSGEHAVTLLQGYTGVLQTDGYAAYRSLADPTRAGGPA